MLVNNKTLKKLILVLVAVSMIIGLTHFASLIARAENDDHLETEIVNTDESQDVDYSYLYEDGKIKIYNLKQLQAIGSHQPVKLTDNNEESFSKGDVLLVENTVITYSLDAQYLLMNDIVLDNENIWSLPDNFTGSFTSLETQNNKTLCWALVWIKFPCCLSSLPMCHLHFKRCKCLSILQTDSLHCVIKPKTPFLLGANSGCHFHT